MKKIVSIVFVLSFGINLFPDNDLKLETIGATAASTLYLSYMAIGVVADAYQNKAYNKNTASGFVREAVAIMGVCKNYMNRLSTEGGLSNNDIATAKKMIETFDLLINEGQSFINYVETNDSKHVKAFHDYRNKAWKNISEILGLNNSK